MAGEPLCKGRRLTWLFALFPFVVATSTPSPLCYEFTARVSSLDSATYHRFLAETQASFPQARQHPWFVPGMEAAIRLSRSNPAEVDEIARTVRCCGLSEAQTKELLLSLLGGAESGTISVRRFHEAAFTRGLARAGVNDPNCVDCMSTALIHFDPSYFARADNADIPNFGAQVFGNLYRETPGGTPLQWGDFLTIERNGQRVHVMVYLSDGLVLHKPGPFSDATIEPITAAREFYRGFFAGNHPEQPNDLTIRTWHRQ